MGALPLHIQGQSCLKFIFYFPTAHLELRLVYKTSSVVYYDGRLLFCNCSEISEEFLKKW
jgi:hypothetical protein